MSRLFDTVIRWCFSFGSLQIGAMALIITYDVIVRYAFARPNIWAMQTTEYIVVYTTFLGAAWLLKNEGHVSIDLVYTRLGRRTQTVLDIITSIVGFCVCVILVWQGSAELAYSYLRSLKYDYYPWPIIQWPTLIAVPFGSLLLSLQFIRRGYRLVVALSQRDSIPSSEKSRTPDERREPGGATRTDCPDPLDKKPAP